MCNYSNEFLFKVYQNFLGGALMLSRSTVGGVEGGYTYSFVALQKQISKSYILLILIPRTFFIRTFFSHPRTVRKKKLIYVNVCFTELKMFKLSLSRNPSVHSRLPSVVLSQKNNATLNYHFHVTPQSLTNGSLFIKE